MRKLRVNCPACGLVEITGSVIELLAERDGEEPASYAFDCSQCHATVRRRASARLLRALAYLGAPVRVASPARLAAEDALVDELRRLLDEPDFVARLDDSDHL